MISARPGTTPGMRTVTAHRVRPSQSVIKNIGTADVRPARQGQSRSQQEQQGQAALHRCTFLIQPPSKRPSQEVTLARTQLLARPETMNEWSCRVDPRTAVGPFAELVTVMPDPVADEKPVLGARREEKLGEKPLHRDEDRQKTAPSTKASPTRLQPSPRPFCAGRDQSPAPEKSAATETAAAPCE